MGFLDEYNKALEEEKKKKKKSTGDFMETYRDTLATMDREEVAAPTVTTGATEKDDGKKWYDGFLRLGDALSDGYQFGDVAKTLLGTDTDIATNFLSGVIGWGEDAIDAGATALGTWAEKKGKTELAENLNKFAQKDLYDPNEVSRKILKSNTLGLFMPQMQGMSKAMSGLFTLEEWLNPEKEVDNGFGGTMTVRDDNSILGDESDAFIQSVGETLTKQGMTAATGIPIGDIITGVTVYGAQAEQALREGATFGQASGSGLVSAGAEIMFEKLSGGVKIGGRTLDEGLTRLISKNISNVALKNGVHFVSDLAGESLEEVLTEFVGKLGTKLYKEEDLGEILFSESALNDYIKAAVAGGLMGGMFNVSGAVSGTKDGRDYKTGLNNDEQKVVDEVFKKETEGKDLSAREKAKIYDKILEDMDKGYLSTDTIEEVLGDKTYLDNLTKEAEEFDKLYNTASGQLSKAQQDRLAELEARNKENPYKDLLNTEKGKFSQGVFERVKGSRLGESYNERARRGQAFEADLSKYDAKQQQTIQKAIDSGILNNTNRTHEFVDMVAKITADKGVPFDFTNNQKLKESGFAVDGKTVNGYVTKDGITVNINSSKSLNSIVGHEITHVLEGTDVYTELQSAIVEYAKSKGDYQGRYDSLSKLYQNIEGANIDAELTADLVGDYLFTDSDFVRNLSVKHRNVFQKIWDEVKYLAKVATAGSKEAKELAKVQRAFEKAYREAGNAKGDTKYSISPETDTAYMDAVNRGDTETAKKMVDEAAKKAGYYIKAYHGTDAEFNEFKRGDVGFHFGTLAQAKSRMEWKFDPSYFTKEQSESLWNIVPAYLHIENPLTIEYDIGDWFAPNVAQHIVESRLISDLTNEEVRWLQSLRYRNDASEISQHYKTSVADDLRKFLRTKGYDGIKYINTYEDGDANDWSYIAFDSSQIKRADPVTHDDKGNIIPLSERFTPENKDIRYSLSDSDGKHLTKEQQEYFKDSKVRDEKGNLKVMYHGSQDAGFHVFDASMSDDNTSFFFVDRNDVAASYSGTSETYEAKTIRSAEDMNKFLAEIGHDEDYSVTEQDGQFILLYDGERVAASDTAPGIYKEFCWYEGVGEGDANYKVYLNLTNPLEVDAEGRNWDNVSREFSQEIADKYKTLTEEEKATLHDLAGWGDIREFRHELNKALDIVESRGGGDGYTRRLASAYQKLGEDINMYDLFSIAEDNFSDLAIEAWAVKQMNTRDYAQKAKAEGYDGVIFKNIVDIGGYGGEYTPSTVAIAFDSNQIKSVANEKPTGDKDIRYSLTEYTEDEKKAHNKAVLDHFGKTYNWAETGYVLLDGSRLDLSGKHEGAPGGYRTVDHRDIVDALGSDYGDDTYSGSLVQFMSEGNIRISPESDGINLSVKPNKAQEQALSAFISRARGEVLLDIDDFNGYTVVSVEYPRGTHANKVLNDIREWFDNGKKPAVSNLSQFRYSLSDTVTEEQNQNGLDVTSEIQYSLSRDTEFSDNAIAKNNAMLHVDAQRMEETKAVRSRIAGRMNEIKDRGLVGLPEDIEGNTYIANSSYDGTEENTTICPRSLASEAFVDAVSEYLGRPLTVEEQIYISQDLQGRSLTPECTYCYVATDRKAYRAFLGDYVAQRDAVLQKVQANTNVDVSRSGELYKEFLNGRKDTNPMYSRFKMWVDAYKTGKPMIDASHLANINKLMGDINSEFGAELKPQIVDAMKYAQSASWAKKRVSYVAYNGHILNWKQDRINKLNSHYGLRMYSFSDFHPAFVLENMQMITDASVRGLKMLGYSKDTDFVEIFAPSGMNINVSTFGFESGGNVYENNIIGAEWAKAKELREQYPNVGVTFVATNDTLVNWALEQDWIDVVIPYHLVRTGAEVAKAFGYTNYTSESADTKTKEWAKGDKKSIAPTEHNNDLETYFKALEKNHLNPRFERFKNHPNYMKLVNECRQSASESKPVQPVFNEDAAMKALAKLEANGYYQPIGGSVERMYEIAAEVAEDMAKELAPAMSLSDVGQQHRKYGSWNVYGKDIRLNNEAASEDIAPIADNATAPVSEATVAENATVAPVTEEELFPSITPIEGEIEQIQAEMDTLTEWFNQNGYNAETAEEYQRKSERYLDLEAKLKELEQQQKTADDERLGTLTDSDVPPVKEAPYYEDAPQEKAPDPFAERDMHEVGKRSVKAYMYENPEVKPYFQAAANAMLGDLNNGVKGEKWYNDELYYESGGEKGWMGVKRHTTDDIAALLDQWGYTYAEIEKGLNAIIEDNGAENNAVSKRIEFMLDDRLRNGYTDVWGEPIPADQGYIELLREKQITEYSKEAFDALMAHADEYAPVAEEVVSKKEKTTPLAKATPDTMDAPIYESKEKDAVKGQTTMFEPPKPNPRVANVLTEEAEIAKKKSGIGSKLVSALVDKGMVFENLSLETGNMRLQSKYNYALPSNTEARAQYLMEHGDKGVKSLKDIKASVEKSGKTAEFYDYLYHVHNIDRMTLADRFMDTPNKPVFGETVTAAESKKTVAQYERANPEFKAMAEDVYRYNRHLRKMLADSGVISRKTAALWQKMYPHYVPIRRVDTQGQNISVPLDSKKTGVNNPVKRATGGSSDIMPLFETMAQRTEQTFRAIARNSFGIELKNTLGTTIGTQETNVDEVIDTIGAQEELLKPGTTTSQPTFTVFENGEKVEFEITEDMFNALKPADGILGYRNKVVQKVGDARRNLLTVWNPVFALYRNPIKDIQDVAVNSQHAAKTYANIPNAIYQMATNGEYATEYHKNGGKSNTYFDGRTNKFKAEDNLFKKIIGMPVRAIESAGEFIEEIPRLAEYIASRQEGRSVERSMLDAARVTTNFAAGGDFTKFLNSHGFTFLNASVQGASQHVRNFREAKQQGLKGYVKVLAKYAVAGLPTILLNSLLWDDDEEYEELSDYVKQNYYVVAKTEDGKFVRIPKGRTSAVIGELMQQMGNLVTGDDEADFSTFFELFMNNIAPNNPIENNILAPILQVKNNEAWYGGDLVPSRLQDLPSEEQYDESTDSISKWLGEKTGTSPYKWNYLIDQYSGGLGDVFLPMLTPEAESGDNSLVGNILAPWKKEVTTDKVLNNKYPGDFYDLKDELEKKSNSSKATEEDTMRSMFMQSVSWDMSDLYKQKREIQNSDLSDAEKYEAVREIQEQINALAESGLKGYNDVSIMGKYSEVGDRRYNYDEENGKWYEIQETNSDGTANYYYEKEQEVTKALGITYEQYWNNREEYNYAYDKPEQYQLARAVGGYQSYRGYTSALWDIKADKDENGKSISGSRKEKVIDYLNELDADYYTKIILFKNEYNADDTYNAEIVEYLNGRDDISYDDMVTILKYLGFEVSGDKVYW